ncbi:MAG: NUDIX domain-containing protein [Spirochaetaceae bacterium]|nr:NUDIX domain-containing protein [Spirochaetaceae bacterium]
MNKTKVQFYEENVIDESKFEFAVILAKFQNKWVYCKHKKRDTWEIPGGHREKGEEILCSAKRELKEETGAEDFSIRPIAVYSVTIGNKTNYGKLFYAEVKTINQNLEHEIEKIQLFDDIPENLTYPEIQPLLHKYILSRIN